MFKLELKQTSQIINKIKPNSQNQENLEFDSITGILDELIYFLEENNVVFHFAINEFDLSQRGFDFLTFLEELPSFLDFIANTDQKAFVYNLYQPEPFCLIVKKETSGSVRFQYDEKYYDDKGESFQSVSIVDMLFNIHCFLFKLNLLSKLFAPHLVKCSLFEVWLEDVMSKVES